MWASERACGSCFGKGEHGVELLPPLSRLEQFWLIELREAVGSFIHRISPLGAGTGDHPSSEKLRQESIARVGVSRRSSQRERRLITTGF